MPDHHGERDITVSIQVHFEAEHKTHTFQSTETWSVVHSWACDKFNISDDVCPNLELRAGSSSGSVLGENTPIGNAEHHRVVWLVKPGAEQFGHADARV